MHAGFTPEPDIPGIRKLDPHFFLGYTTDLENNLLLRETHYHFSATLINGGNVWIEWNKDYEFVDEPFSISGEGITPKKIERAIALSKDKYCSVYHSIRSDIEVNIKYEIG